VLVLQAEMLAAGVMPALSSLLPTAAASEQLLPAALQLLELLLQQDRAAATEAMKCEMLPAIAAVYKNCNSGMRAAVNAVLLLLVKPPLAPASATLPPAPAAIGGQGQASPSSTANSKKPAAAAAAASTAAVAHLPAAVSSTSGAGVCLQEVQSELGRCCSTASVLAAMQLMSQGE
jgi:hypothetical protein